MDINPVVLIVAGSVLALVTLSIFVFLWLTKPGTRKSDIKRYLGVKFAHRGLHDGGRAENSMSAFRAARDAGFGIELDVRLAADGKLVVFHDDTLGRVCGVDGKVIEKTTEELAALNLKNTGEGIPTFKDVLALIDGAVPLLIEIKMDMGESGVAEALVKELEGYRGDYIIESFNPLALRTIKKLMPNVPRGILSEQFLKAGVKKNKLLFFGLEHLLFNFLMRPDFIAYEKNGAKNGMVRLLRRTFGTPLFAWTVRSEEEETRAVSDGFDTVIFESYVPKK